MKRRALLGFCGKALLLGGAGNLFSPEIFAARAAPLATTTMLLIDPHYAASRQLAAQNLSAERFVLNGNAVEVWRRDLHQLATTKNFRLDAITTYADYLTLVTCFTECGLQVASAEAIQFMSRDSIERTSNAAPLGVVTLWRWSIG